jgi:hypothetical protein
MMDRQLMPDAMTFKGRTEWPEEETIQLDHDAVPPMASPPRGRLLFVSHDASDRSNRNFANWRKRSSSLIRVPRPICSRKFP